MRNPLLLAMLPCVLATACTKQQHDCTAIGCTAQFTAQLTLPSGQAPQFDVDITIAGVVVRCGAPSTIHPTPCVQGVSLSIREEQTCTDTTTGNAVIHTCVGTGRFSEFVEVQGAPATVGIILRQGGASQDLGTITPTYQTNQPNGPDCEPTCKYATVTKLIESWP